MPNLAVNRAANGAMLQQTWYWSMKPPYTLSLSASSTNYTVRKSLTAVNRTSVNSPRFAKLVKLRRLLPVNNFSFSEDVTLDAVGETYDCSGGAGSAMIIRKGDIRTMVGDPLPPLELSSADLIALDNQAKTALLLKIKDQKINMAQTYAEREQTFQLVAKTATRIARCYSSLRKGNFVAAANHLGVKARKRARRRYEATYPTEQSKAVADGWLALQYGWKPLLNDVYGSAELLAQKIMKEQITRVEVVKRKRLTESRNTNGYVDTRASVYTIKYVCRFTDNNTTLRSMAQIGLTNPALIAWELTPFSFVVDWFIPIGNFVSSLDATFGLAFNAGSKTTFLRGTSNRVVRTGAIGKTPVPTAYRSFQSSRRKVTCVRTALTGFPGVTLPTFKNPFSFDHVANALALLRSTLKGK